MSDDARQLIDNPYRASHTPIYVGDVNVTDLMARAWDRGFAAGDERLRAMLGKVPREQLGRIMQEVAATPNAPKADVRRWTPAYGPNGSCCYENENGDYVLARDYDDLAAASPDERLREAAGALVVAAACAVCEPGPFHDNDDHLQWKLADAITATRAALAADRDSLGREAGDRHMSDNPYPNASDTMHYELHTAWDEGYAEGFAAGRAALPDNPETPEGDKTR